MKRLLISILFLLPVFLYGQRTAERFMTLNCQIAQVGSSGGFPHISCNCNDQGGKWDSNDVLVGDSLMFTDGGDGYKLPINLIVTPGSPTLVIRVDFGATGLVLVPTGSGSISRGALNTLDADIAGMSQGDREVFREDYISRIRLDQAINKVTKEGDADGVPLRFGTNDVQDVQLEVNNVVELTADGTTGDFTITNKVTIDNEAVAEDILDLKDNGTTVFKVEDGGNVSATQNLDVDGDVIMGSGINNMVEVNGQLILQRGMVNTTVYNTTVAGPVVIPVVQEIDGNTIAIMNNSGVPVTYTPATGTVQGGADITLASGEQVILHRDEPNTNWLIMSSTSTGGGGATIYGYFTDDAAATTGSVPLDGVYLLDSDNPYGYGRGTPRARQ